VVETGMEGAVPLTDSAEREGRACPIGPLSIPGMKPKGFQNRCAIDCAAVARHQHHLEAPATMT
jgi:hypothetical protein